MAEELGTKVKDPTGWISLGFDIIGGTLMGLSEGKKNRELQEKLAKLSLKQAEELERRMQDLQGETARVTAMYQAVAVIEKEKLIDVEKVEEAAIVAKNSGSTRFCMGAAWRNPTDRDLEIVCNMIKKVSSLGLETCATLGMLNKEQAKKLADAGLDYYNHNIDTSENYYKKIITTRKFEDRLNTLNNVRKAGLKVCCGGILGMGETLKDRIEMLKTLANLPKHPESVPLNQLIKISGTPLENKKDLNPFDLIKTIAVARIMMPKSYIRLSAGRTNMNDSTQALAFFAGANSIFQGDVLLTAPNPDKNRDALLFDTLGLNSEKISIPNNA